jgi:hypothetical protein
MREIMRIAPLGNEPSLIAYECRACEKMTSEIWPTGQSTNPSDAPSTGLRSGIDKDRADYTVYSGGWDVGRIYEIRGGPDSLRWFWPLTVTGPMTRSDRVASLEEAKAQFKKSWDAWKAWAKLEEIE